MGVTDIEKEAFTVTCPFCQSGCEMQRLGDKAVFRVRCPKCGQCDITLVALATMEQHPALLPIIRQEVRKTTHQEGCECRVDSKMLGAFLDEDGNVLEAPGWK